MQLKTVNGYCFSLIDENHYDFSHVLLTDWMDKPDILPMSNSFDRLLRGFQETPTRIDQPSYNPLVLACQSQFELTKLFVFNGCQRQ